MDKSDWGPGAWQEEPDKVQWPDEATGLPCLAVRNGMGNWCGYVGVAVGHPWHGKDYGDAIGPCTDKCDPEYHWDHRIESIIEVHGGVTFADACQPREDESRGICHAPDMGEPDHVWWFGFDCGHSDDLSPAMMARERKSVFGETRYGSNWQPTYKALGYVRAEVAKLAQQLKSVAL
jgi:hypothetical protein